MLIGIVRELAAGGKRVHELVAALGGCCDPRA